jgi:hypothetical protein
MKTPTLILVVATTGLAVACVQFARQAASEKARADAQLAVRQKQDARIRDLERAQANLERQLLEAQRPRMSEPPVAMRVPPPTSPGPATSRVEARQGEQGAGVTAVRRPPFMRGPMDSAAGRKFMRTQVRDNIRRLYGDAGRELNLPQEQADQLIELLADQQTRNFDERRQLPADRASARQDLQEQNTKEIASLIGSDRMAEWKAYQDTLPQRSQVGVIGQQLDQAGVPLSADQRSQLVTAMVEESQRNPQPTAVQGMAPEDVMKQQNEWQDAYGKAVSDRAKQLLSSEQYDRYHQYEEWMAEMRRNLPRPMNGGGSTRMIAGGTVAPGTGPVIMFQPAEGAAAAPPPAPR